MIVDVQSINLQNGIANALDAKLDAVLNALTDVNENNDVAACNAMEAFINSVLAQADNKITLGDAAELILKAEEILVCLGCP